MGGLQLSSFQIYYVGIQVDVREEYVVKLDVANRFEVQQDRRDDNCQGLVVNFGKKDSFYLNNQTDYYCWKAYFGISTFEDIWNYDY